MAGKSTLVKQLSATSNLFALLFFFFCFFCFFFPLCVPFLFSYACRSVPATEESCDSRSNRPEDNASHTSGPGSHRRHISTLQHFQLVQLRSKKVVSLSCLPLALCCVVSPRDSRNFTRHKFLSPSFCPQGVTVLQEIDRESERLFVTHFGSNLFPPPPPPPQSSSYFPTLRHLEPLPVYCMTSVKIIPFYLRTRMNK